MVDKHFDSDKVIGTTTIDSTHKYRDERAIIVLYFPTVDPDGKLTLNTTDASEGEFHESLTKFRGGTE